MLVSEEFQVLLVAFSYDKLLLFLATSFYGYTLNMYYSKDSVLVQHTVPHHWCMYYFNYRFQFSHSGSKKEKYVGVHWHQKSILSCKQSWPLFWVHVTCNVELKFKVLLRTPPTSSAYEYLAKEGVGFWYTDQILVHFDLVLNSQNGILYWEKVPRNSVVISSSIFDIFQAPRLLFRKINKIWKHNALNYIEWEKYQNHPPNFKYFGNFICIDSTSYINVRQKLIQPLKSSINYNSTTLLFMIYQEKAVQNR